MVLLYFLIFPTSLPHLFWFWVFFSFYIFGVVGLMCMCMIIVWENHLCVRVCVCTHTCTQDNLFVIPQEPSTIFLFFWLAWLCQRQGLWPGAHQVTDWTGRPGNPRISFSACSAQGLLVHNTIPSFFYVGSGNRTQVLILVRQARLPSECINIPTTYSSNGVKRMSFSMTERGLLFLTS